MSKIKVILADDHDIFRDGIRSLLVNEDIADIVGEARNGKEFLRVLDATHPDLVIMDIAMPDMDGYEATKRAIARYPDLKILILSMYGEEEYYLKMIQAGVKGFVLKSSGIGELISAINDIYHDGTYFSNELLRKVIITISNTKQNDAQGEKVQLTEREVEVLNLICKGMTNDEIAESLFLSPNTIKGYRTEILSKTGCKNTASLVMYALKNKFVTI